MYILWVVNGLDVNIEVDIGPGDLACGFDVDEDEPFLCGSGVVGLEELVQGLLGDGEGGVCCVFVARGEVDVRVLADWDALGYC